MNNFLSLHIARPYVYTLLIVGLSFGTYKHIELINKSTSTEIELLNTNINLKTAKLDNEQLTIKLKESINEQLVLKDTVDDISKQVGTLVKIQNTDKELLQKYSKIYFLNENYIPRKVSMIPSIYLTPNSKQLEINAEVLPFLRSMVRASIKANNPIQIVSAYRSFGTQANLKTAYKVSYGAGANTFSADQGYSEHQLGTTVDLTTPILKDTFVSFEDTPAFMWLKEHAHEYGFTLSYPKGNKYYTYEPWHWRFVGIELATKLYDDGKYFYDLDQREIDEYLLNIFD